MPSTQTVRITLRGRLSGRAATLFEGMTVQRRRGLTDLIGPLADQTQLHGFLARIRDLGLELVSLSVSPCESDREDAEP